LKEKRNGFDELQAQALIKQATKGLAYLHKRRVAMQDVSLENMLLGVDEASGAFNVKVCDPGQAAIFEVLDNGEEVPVNFRGLVGKSFRPPELHQQKSYMATKVDSWCLGWSTFYLLTAQPLFFSADPAQQDQDWILFEQGDYKTLFTQKSNLCSHTGLDFIFRLMQLEPSRRMSVTDALDHAWLQDPKICPVLAPKELLPEAREQKAAAEGEAAEAKPQGSHQVAEQEAAGVSANQAGAPHVAKTTVSPGGITWPPSVGQTSQTALVSAGSGELPTWAAAAGSLASPGVPGSMLRVVSPVRSPRTTAAAQGVPARLAVDHRRSRGRMAVAGSSARLPYVVATAHSPAPVGHTPLSPLNQGGSAQIRAVSPMQGQHVLLQHRPKPPEGSSFVQPAFMTPRMASRPRSPDAKADGTNGATSPSNGTAVVAGDTRQPAWAFRAQRQGSHDGTGEDGGSVAQPPVDLQQRTIRTSSPMASRALSPHAGIQGSRVVQQGGLTFQTQGRVVQSPTRGQGHVFPMQRSLSPVAVVQQVVPGRSGAVRTASPVAAVRHGGGGFSWTQVPASFSPREGSPAPQGSAAHRTSSPMTTISHGVGFSFKPDPPSPRLLSRAASPPHASGAITFPRGAATLPARGQVVIKR